VRFAARRAFSARTEQAGRRDVKCGTGNIWSERPAGFPYERVLFQNLKKPAAAALVLFTQDLI
jgi:hypothetical protein